MSYNPFTEVGRLATDVDRLRSELSHKSGTFEVQNIKNKYYLLEVKIENLESKVEILKADIERRLSDLEDFRSLIMEERETREAA